MPTPSAIFLTKLSPRDHLFHRFSCKSNTPALPDRCLTHRSTKFLYLTLLTLFASLIIVVITARNVWHTGDPINSTSLSPPIWLFSTTSSSLAADASFALLAASACLIASSGPSRAAATLVATDGCSPADETRCSVARNFCWPRCRSSHMSHSPLRCRARSLCQRLNRQIYSATLEFAAVTPAT